MAERERAPRNEKAERPREGDTASNPGAAADGRRRERDKERERSKPDMDGKVSLLVRNLNKRTSAEEIKKFFEQYGTIKDVYLPKDYYSGYARTRAHALAGMTPPGTGARAGCTTGEMHRAVCAGRRPSTRALAWL